MAFDTSYDIIYRNLHYSIPRGCPLNTGFTVAISRRDYVNNQGSYLKLSVSRNYSAFIIVLSITHVNFISVAINIIIIVIRLKNQPALLIEF